MMNLQQVRVDAPKHPFFAASLHSVLQAVACSATLQTRQIPQGEPEMKKTLFALLLLLFSTALTSCAVGFYDPFGGHNHGTTYGGGSHHEQDD